MRLDKYEIGVLETQVAQVMDWHRESPAEVMRNDYVLVHTQVYWTALDAAWREMGVTTGYPVTPPPRLSAEVENTQMLELAIESGKDLAEAAGDENATAIALTFTKALRIAAPILRASQKA